MGLKNGFGEGAVNGQYLILENQLRTAKNGSSYLAMKIGDDIRELAVKVWDADEEFFHRLEVGKVITINNIQPKTFKDQIQLEWEAKNDLAFTLVPDSEIDYSRFLPRSPGNLVSYWDYLQNVIDTIKEPFYQRTVAFFFGNSEFKADFIRVPAALKRHHAYIGGLLEHTAGVAALCQAAADYYPLVNRDLLLTGAMLHDIGKVKTYKINKGFDGTDEGKLIGHLVLGVEMVQQVTTNISESSEIHQKMRNNLLHLLISHHGIMEWGSPVEPLTLEACILHHADNMDAQIIKFLTIIRTNDNSSNWAPYDPGLGRSIYLGASQSEVGSTLKEREMQR